MNLRSCSPPVYNNLQSPLLFLNTITLKSLI